MLLTNNTFGHFSEKLSGVEKALWKVNQVKTVSYRAFSSH